MNNKHLALIFVLLCLTLVPSVSLWAAENEWQFKAAEAIGLTDEAGMRGWQNNLPMLWSEPDTVRRWFGPKVHQDKLRAAVALFQTIPDHAVDNQVALAWAIAEANLGSKRALELLSRENAEGGMDLRLQQLDLALYLRDWNSAELLANSLESEGVQPSVTYRRAVLAGLRGKRLLAESLWREAIHEGIPITQAIYKELFKSGLGKWVNRPNLSTKLQNYLDTMDFVFERKALTSTLIPEGYQKGITAYEAARYEEALREWRKISTTPEMRLSLNYMMGQALNRLKRFEESEILWRETIKANPEFFLGYLGLADALQGKGQPQKAEHWLKVGFRRTHSVFLLNNTAITPSNLKEAKGWIHPGPLPGYRSVELDEGEFHGIDSLWVSWNYGRDWLLYPFFSNRLSLPMGKEYWLKGTGKYRNAGSPDLALRMGIVNKPTVISPITVSNMGLGELPVVTGEWSLPVELRFEYWSPGEPRFVLKEKALTKHRLVLENTAPGRVYRYRAHISNDGFEVGLTEGEFSTEDTPFWVGLRRPAGMSGFRKNRVEIPIKGEGLLNMHLTEVRWAESDEPWSAWSKVRTMMSVDLTPQSGTKRILFQFKDPKGRLSPVLSENAIVDGEPPRFLKLHQRKSRQGMRLDWQTDEPTIGRLWVRIDDQWRQILEESIYTTTHRFDLSESVEKVQLWAEDRAGNLAVGFDEADIGRSPISLRINGGDSYTAERLVHLGLGWCKKPIALIRFSNDRKLWGPWRPIADLFQWRLEAGEGEKTVYAQVQEDNGSYELKARITLDQTPPKIHSLEFKTNNQGETSLEWNTSKNVRARIYWATAGEPLHFLEEPDYAAFYRVNLGKLKETRYIWRLEAQDEAGNQTIMTDGWFQGQHGQKLTPIAWGAASKEVGKQRVWLKFEAQDEPPIKLRLRQRGGAWEAWQPFKKSLLWTLKSGFEQQWVEAQFMDEHGNISPISSKCFYSQIRPARVYGISIQEGADDGESSFLWRADKKVRGWLLIQRLNDGKYQDYARNSFLDFSMGGRLILGHFEPGVYRMRLFVEDLSGNWSWSRWVEHEVTEAVMPSKK